MVTANWRGCERGFWWHSFRSEMDRLFDRFSGGIGFPSLRRMFDVEPAWQLCRARDRHERRREGVQADITGFAGQQVLDSLPLVITKCKSVHESALFQADSP